LAKPEIVEEDSYRCFTELEVWKKARILKKDVRELTKSFPPEEKFRLTDQLIRSSRSVCSLIAEGHGRYTYKDRIHYCIEARGSLTETLNHLIEAFDGKYITNIELKKFRLQIAEVHALLNGYIAYLRRRSESTSLKKGHAAK